MGSIEASAELRECIVGVLKGQVVVKEIYRFAPFYHKLLFQKADADASFLMRDDFRLDMSSSQLDIMWSEITNCECLRIIQNASPVPCPNLPWKTRFYNAMLLNPKSLPSLFRQVAGTTFSDPRLAKLRLHNGKTVLHYVASAMVYARSAEVWMKHISGLVQAGADLNSCDQDGKHPLNILVQECFFTRTTRVLRQFAHCLMNSGVDRADYGSECAESDKHKPLYNTGYDYWKCGFTRCWLVFGPLPDDWDILISREQSFSVYYPQRQNPVPGAWPKENFEPLPLPYVQLQTQEAFRVKKAYLGTESIKGSFVLRQFLQVTWEKIHTERNLNICPLA